MFANGVSLLFAPFARRCRSNGVKWDWQSCDFDGEPSAAVPLLPAPRCSSAWRSQAPWRAQPSSASPPLARRPPQTSWAGPTPPTRRRASGAGTWTPTSTASISCPPASATGAHKKNERGKGRARRRRQGLGWQEGRPTNLLGPVAAASGARRRHSFPLRLPTCAPCYLLLRVGLAFLGCDGSPASPCRAWITHDFWTTPQVGWAGAHVVG